MAWVWSLFCLNPFGFRQLWTPSSFLSHQKVGYSTHWHDKRCFFYDWHDLCISWMHRQCGSPVTEYWDFWPHRLTMQPITENHFVISTCRHIHDESLEHLRSILALQSWEEVIKYSDVETSFNAFLIILTLALNSACPLKRTQIKPNGTIKPVLWWRGSWRDDF